MLDRLAFPPFPVLRGERVTLRAARGSDIDDRLGHPIDSRRILLEQARGNLQYTQGDLRDAVTTLSHALDRAEALWGKDDPRLIPLLRDRAAAEGRLRDLSRGPSGSLP